MELNFSHISLVGYKTFLLQSLIDSIFLPPPKLLYKSTEYDDLLHKLERQIKNVKTSPTPRLTKNRGSW